MLLRENIGVPLCFPVIKRPRQIRKMSRYTKECRWLLGEDLAFGALPRLKCGPCAIHSVGFVQAGASNGHGVVFFPSCCKFHRFYSLRGLFLPCGTCGAPCGTQV